MPPGDPLAAWPASRGQAYLRQFGEADAGARRDFYVKNRAHFETHSGVENDEFYTAEGQRAIIRSQHADQEADDGYYWGLFLSPGGALIGVISLTGIVRGPFQAAWIGYSMDEAHTAKGMLPGRSRRWRPMHFGT